MNAWELWLMLFISAYVIIAAVQCIRSKRKR